eukprot:765547-Hanusia_phi.AAC.1
MLPMPCPSALLPPPPPMHPCSLRSNPLNYGHFLSQLVCRGNTFHGEGVAMSLLSDINGDGRSMYFKLDNIF